MSKVTKTYLKDYQAPHFEVDHFYLDFELDEQKTRVQTEIQITPKLNSKALFLDGEHLEFLSLKINGTDVPSSDYSLSESGLTLKTYPAETFKLQVENTCSPVANTAYEGLYKSGDILCTQCEAEGFRRITYFFDRPDVMTSYKVKLTGDKSTYPYLLSNGNLLEEGENSNGTHWALWEDPFKKPSYLFAIVAGNFDVIQDQFKTMSGRQIELFIYSDPGESKRCEFAMESLKRSMKWDEERFNLECDLDRYMIVAVSSFNMGAMENKGLNIFNSVLVLASPESVSDDAFKRIEGVIGHEYFHNWTGNRVTCQNWFQLTLKEGLTVFRDQEFTADLHSRAVQRIDDVTTLKSRQFPEDAGPMSHPIRPEEYSAIDNFYTATVYDKGAEVIRMIHTIIGEDNFQKGMKIYFDRHDGSAVTTEDFLSAMETADPSFDRSLFENWYSQKGTPQLQVHDSYNEATGEYQIRLEQHIGDQAAFCIPLKFGLLSLDGKKLEYEDSGNTLFKKDFILLKSKSETFKLKCSQKPVLSLNRGFSAPLQVLQESPVEHQITLGLYDTDSFNRFHAVQSLFKKYLLGLYRDNLKPDLKLACEKLFERALEDAQIDDSYRSQLLTPPSYRLLVSEMKDVDFIKLKKAYEQFYDNFYGEFGAQMLKSFQNLVSSEPKEFKWDFESTSRRSLKGTLSSYLISYQENKTYLQDLYFSSNNMTDQLSALYSLSVKAYPDAQKCLGDFHAKWKNDEVVILNYLGAQALSPMRESLTSDLEALAASDCFDEKIPNHVSRLWGSLMSNVNFFHNPDGSGYKYIVNKISEIDEVNPHVSSGLTRQFQVLARAAEPYQSLMRKELVELFKKPNLSKNTKEVLDRILS